MNNRIEEIVGEFFNKFFPDLADKVHQEQSDWLSTALDTIYTNAYNLGRSDAEYEANNK